MVESLAGALLFVIGAATGVLVQLVQRHSNSPSAAVPAEAPAAHERATRLASALSESADVIRDLQEEIEKRESAAAALRRDVQGYTDILSAKRREVEAVAKLLRTELRKEGRRTLMQNLAVNSAFFLLGGLTSFLLARVL